MKTIIEIHIYKLLKMNYLNIAFITLTLIFSCSASDTEPNNTPSDLTVNVTIIGANDVNPYGDGSGIVQVSASAKNAIRYEFSLENEDLQNSQSGSIEYTLTKGGTHQYSISVWAYSETGRFINRTVNFDVHKSEVVYTTLVFSDEFEYEGSPDAEKWHHQVIPPSNGSWYNEEQQHYTNRTKNSFASDGTLKIVALKEEYSTEGSIKSYTSARLNSKFAFTYGRLEVRAKLPSETGTWPAIWTLGANSNETGNYFGDQYGNIGWPNCGEIDILEQNGWDKNNIISHFHWGDKNTGDYKNAGGTISISDASTEFHTYSIEWNSSMLKVSVDDELVYELANTSDKPYNEPHYLILNIAMGGTLGGNIPENFAEDTLEIDYVRVYQ